MCGMRGCNGFGLRRACGVQGLGERDWCHAPSYVRCLDAIGWACERPRGGKAVACARNDNEEATPTHQPLPCLAKWNRAAVPSFVPDMRPSCLACDAPAWRTMLALRKSFDGWQLQAFRRWLGDATLALRGKRFARWAPAMYVWIRLIELARGLSWTKHRLARVQDYITREDWQLLQGLDLRDDFWQLPQGLDLRSGVGHRAKNLSGIALKVFILKPRGVWITSIRWVRLVNGLGWARPRFARLDLDIAKFDLHVMQDRHLRSRHCPAPDFSPPHARMMQCLDQRKASTCARDARRRPATHQPYAKCRN
mgnify:CR=1 FL=1